MTVACPETGVNVRHFFSHEPFGCLKQSVNAWRVPKNSTVVRNRWRKLKHHAGIFELNPIRIILKPIGTGRIREIPKRSTRWESCTGGTIGDRCFTHGEAARGPEIDVEGDFGHIVRARLPCAAAHDWPPLRDRIADARICKNTWRKNVQGRVWKQRDQRDRPRLYPPAYCPRSVIRSPS